MQHDRYICIVKNNNTIERKNWRDLNEINNALEKGNWLKATETEIMSLKKNKTWKLVIPSPNKELYVQNGPSNIK